MEAAIALRAWAYPGRALDGGVNYVCVVVAAASRRTMEKVLDDQLHITSFS